MKKPLNDSSSEEEWADAAKQLGLSVDDLKAQIKLADSILEELFKEETSGEQHER